MWEMTARGGRGVLQAAGGRGAGRPGEARRSTSSTRSPARVCHSPVDSEKRMLPGMRLAGGLRMHLAPFGDVPDRQSHIRQGDRSRQLDRRRDQARRSPKASSRDGTRLLPFPMDWASFSTMKPTDINAIVAYLRTVPPVRNKVPRPTRTFLPLLPVGQVPDVDPRRGLPS